MGLTCSGIRAALSSYALTGDIRPAKDALGKFRRYGKPCWMRKIEYDIAGLDTF
jgi:hypothetical protein